MLSDLSNEAQTKAAQCVWDASKKDRQGTSQDTRVSWLKETQNPLLVCVCETEKDKYSEGESDYI